MKKQEVIIVGWINKGRPATCGETMKNQMMIDKLKSYYDKIYIMDFFQWRKHPWVFLNLVFTLFFHPKAKLILSSSPQNIYPIMKMLYYTRSKRKVVHWVIGGSLHKKVEEGIYKAKYLNYLSANLVESTQMVSSLKANHIGNAVYVPNFKPVKYIPSYTPEDKGIKRFVFLSRIKPEKGVDYILNSIEELNRERKTHNFIVDFYGKIDPSYEKKFFSQIERLPNASYKGILNFYTSSGYDTLAGYHAMLFPTYWRGEGFAGIFIDAFISGLPIIASDWGHNREIIKDNETGIIIPVHDVNSLTGVMNNIISGKIDLKAMSGNCKKEAMLYDTDHVITKELLLKIGLLD